MFDYKIYIVIALSMYTQTTHKRQRILDASAKEDLDSDPNDINEGWPEKAHYLQAAPGTRNISIMVQPQLMKAAIKAATTQITAYALFETAFPQLEPAESLKHHRGVLVKSAKNLGNMELTQRFKRDDNLVVVSARVVSFIYFIQLYYVDYFII